MHDLQAILSSLPRLSHDEMVALRDALDVRLEGSSSPAELTAEAWVQDFRRWAESHQRLTCEADDRRESIHGYVIGH